MSTENERIEFLREFRKFEEKYPQFSICLDGEYSNGFDYERNDGCWQSFEENIIKNYYNRSCKSCGLETKECEKYCESCSSGCDICGRSTYSICSYCNKTKLCDKVFLHLKEDAMTACGMIHFARSPECWEKYKYPFKDCKNTDWSWHDSIIEQIRKSENGKN